jgi:hypothetical protein
MSKKKRRNKKTYSPDLVSAGFVFGIVLGAVLVLVIYALVT